MHPLFDLLDGRAKWNLLENPLSDSCGVIHLRRYFGLSGMNGQCGLTTDDCGT
jgi:hypothetical protein